MPFNVTVIQTAVAGPLRISDSRTLSGQTLVTMAEAVDTGESDKELGLSVIVADLKAVVMQSTVDMTVKTNDDSNPQETFSLEAGKPVIFEEGDTAIFSGDVSGIFVTNASGSNGVLNLWVLSDA